MTAVHSMRMSILSEWFSAHGTSATLDLPHKFLVFSTETHRCKSSLPSISPLLYHGLAALASVFAPSHLPSILPLATLVDYPTSGGKAHQVPASSVCVLPASNSLLRFTRKISATNASGTYRMPRRASSPLPRKSAMPATTEAIPAPKAHQ